MKKTSILIASILLLLVVHGVICLGEEQNKKQKTGFSFLIEPLWIGVAGLNAHAGDIVQIKSIYQPWNYNDYSHVDEISYEPINHQMQKKIILRLEAVYRKNQWGLGGSIWWYNTDSTRTGIITTPPRDPGLHTEYKNGLHLWDATFWPLQTDLETSGYSPINYNLKNNLNTHFIDLFGLRTLTSNADNQLEMIFGIKLGSMKNQRNENMNTKSRIYYSSYYRDANVSGENNSATELSFITGPFIGFQGHASYKRIHIEGSISQAIVRSKAKYSAALHYTEDIKYVDPSFPYKSHYGQDIVLSRNDTAVFPMTELKLRFGVNLLRNLSVGLGGFYSVWWNAPVASMQSYPEDIWNNLSIISQERTLSFFGTSLEIGFSF